MATRLAKRWIACHMLTPDIGENLTEVLMVAVYTCPSMLQPPASPLAGLNGQADVNFMSVVWDVSCGTTLSRVGLDIVAKLV